MTGETSSFTIHRVYVRPGKPFAFGQDANKWTNCLSNVPTVPAQEGSTYIPMPYKFRLPPAPKPTRIGRVEARCPPYYVLVDHLIAVIWLIWSKKEEKAPLGINQLHWALAFLKTIFNRRGEHPADIELCMDRIEKILFEDYAKLYMENNKLSQMNESFRYADGAVFSKSIITTQVPFSINYLRMVNTLGEGVGNVMETVTSITSADAAERLTNLKKTAGVKSIEQLDARNKKNAVDVLKAWHAKETKRLLNDMRKLKTIEQKIKHVDEGDFPGLSKDRLDNLLQALEEEDEESEEL